MATALIRKLGLPIQGYTAPQVITHGGEPKGYILGTKGVECQGQVITHNQNGYETYSSLYTASTCTKDKACSLKIQCLSDFIPLLGCNTYENCYYQCNTDVSTYYDCNRKINEANIPYISGNLIAYGCLSPEVLPMTHISKESSQYHWQCVTKCAEEGQEWSRLYTACDVQYLYSCINDIPRETIKQVNICRIKADLYNSSLDTIACPACFCGEDPTNNNNGFILMAMYTPEAILCYNNNTFYTRICPTSTSFVLSPNCGEYLATFYKNGSDYYITGIHSYNIGTNTIGPNIYNAYFCDELACRKLICRGFYFDTQHTGTCFALANMITNNNTVTWDGCTPIFAYIELIEHPISDTLKPYCNHTPRDYETSLGSSFINGMQLYSCDPTDANATIYLDFYDVPLRGYCYYENGTLCQNISTPVDIASHGQCLCNRLIYRVALDSAYVPSAFTDIRQYHWDVCEKTTLTNILERMEIQATLSNNGDSGGT